MDRMLITLDKALCKRCGTCHDSMGGYCIMLEDGYPVFDAGLCNTCQKCVAICPSRAIMVNGVHAEKLSLKSAIDPEQVYTLLEKRRSIKRFSEKELPVEILEKILSVAKYAPNQNKNLSVMAVNDPALINAIDKRAVRFVKIMHRVLFGFPPVTWFVRLFYRDIGTIRRKMEFGSFRRVIYENAQAVILVHGDRNVPVTESSAHYMLSTMMMMAEALGVGSCLMDSVYLAFKTDRKLRKRFGIRDNVLGAMILGYSGENIVNIPRGYEVPIRWNAGDIRTGEKE